MTTVIKQETISYGNDTWELIVSESSSGGIEYQLFTEGDLIVTFNTADLVKLEQIINQAVPSIHSDRSRLLS